MQVAVQADVLICIFFNQHSHYIDTWRSVDDDLLITESYVWYPVNDTKHVPPAETDIKPIKEYLKNFENSIQL